MDPSWQPDAGRVRTRTPRLLRLNLAAMVITPSEPVRRQAIERFRIHPDRIAAVPLAAAERFRPLAGPPPPRPYFLYVGALEPRKNLPFLVNAWRPVRDAHGVELVLAGRPRADFPGLAPEPGLRLPGETAEQDLPALYSGALAFVYPSFYEGFGLPVLEAMLLGTPVLASTTSSVPEVAGDAAMLVDPYNTEAIGQALRRLDEDDDLCDELSARGRKQAEKFSEAAYAKRLHAL